MPSSSSNSSSNTNATRGGNGNGIVGGGGTQNNKNILNSYETEAFSTNVTPPLNFKEVNGAIKQPIFGGNTRATTVIETQLEIPDDIDGIVESGAPIPAFAQLYNNNKNKSTNTPSSPSRRLSFAFTSSSDPSETLSSSSKRGASTTYTYGGTIDKSNSKVKSPLAGTDSTRDGGTSAGIPPPAIPDELFAALSLPPGTAINATTIKKAAESVNSPSSRSAIQHAKLPSL